MAVIVDTTRLAVADRADAVLAAMSRAGIPAAVTLHEPAAVDTVVSVHPVGDTTTLVHRRGTGLRLDRQARHVRRSTPDRLALTVLGDGHFRYAQAGHAEVGGVRGPGMVLTDHTAAYEFDRTGRGEMFAVNLDHDVLGVPHALVANAVGRLHASPLFDLVRHDVAGVGRLLERGDASLPTVALGDVMVDLVRALVLSASADEPAAVHEMLGYRVKRYVERHFREPGLTAVRVAAAHHISVRQLYATWAEDVPLAEWVQRRRLQAASEELGGPGTATVAAIAQRCGYRDAQHFSRKFRAAFGVTPREFRVHAAHLREQTPGPG